MPGKLDLSCFSYLASAQVLQIQKYPELNSGAEILEVVETLAADAPMVAIVAAKLGLSVGLISNHLGGDTKGQEIIETLKKHEVVNTIKSRPDKKTPFITVLSDKNGNREWLSYVKEVAKTLLTVSLSQIKTASMVYIDLYREIMEASLRAVDYGTENNVPIYINLSGNIPTQDTISRLSGKTIQVVQIGLHESLESEAGKILRSLYQALKPRIAIATLASKGAVAIEANKIVQADAFQTNVLHVHGAGALFSGGFIYGQKKNWSLARTLEFACAIGSLGCSKMRGFEDFELGEINKLIQSKMQ